MTELLTIFTLTLFGGVLSLAESAVVTARRRRLEQDAKRGERSAKRVLAVLEHSGQFLAAIHGVATAVSVATGMYAGVVVTRELAGASGASPYLRVALVLGIGALVVYFTALFTELVPRRLALAHPEAIAKVLVPPLSLITRALSPFVWVVDRSAGLLLRSVAAPKRIETDVSEEDIKSLVTEGSRLGVIEEGERQIIHRVFRLGDRPVESLMTPRSEVVFLSLYADIQDTLAQALAERFTWFPVRGHSDDEVIGILSIHDLVRLAGEGAGSEEIRGALKQPLQVPDSITALRLLDLFRKEKARFALVVDEYGGLAGISTVHDVIEVIVGDLGDSDDAVPRIVTRDDGSLLVDARIDIQELFEALLISDAQPFEDREFHSLGGFVMSTLGHVPSEGESFTAFQHHFEVVDMDGNRIDKVWVSRVQSNANIAQQ